MARIEETFVGNITVGTATGILLRWIIVNAVSTIPGLLTWPVGLFAYVYIITVVDSIPFVTVFAGTLEAIISKVNAISTRTAVGVFARSLEGSLAKACRGGCVQGSKQKKEENTERFRRGLLT